MSAWRLQTMWQWGLRSNAVPAHNAIAVLAAERSLHARDALIRHTLHEADVELHFVPLHDSPLNLEEGQADLRVWEAWSV